MDRYFLITIDTEGDNLWERTSNIKTENAEYIGRFQKLCEKYELKPTYLVNYEMAINKDFISLSNEALSKNTCEIGMHLHAWNSPPVYNLSNDDYSKHPFLIEYPANIMEDKVRYMTDLLESAYKRKIVSHRAGRWAINSTYINILKKYGYEIDCSITPYIDRSEKCKYDDKKVINVDYSKALDSFYEMDEFDVLKRGNSGVYQIPFTVIKNEYGFIDTIRNKLSLISLIRKGLNYLFPQTLRLRPNGKNLKQMKKIVDISVEKKFEYIEFMLHSSEFMAGGSPTFITKRSIDKLYSDMDQLFSYVKEKDFKGVTLNEFKTYRSERSSL